MDERLYKVLQKRKDLIDDVLKESEIKEILDGYVQEDANEHPTMAEMSNS